MRIGTADANSTFFSQGLALKRSLEKEGIPGPIEIITSLVSSTHNVAALQRGDLDFGFLAANWLGKAMSGLPPFAEPTDLRIVAPMNAGPMFFVTRASTSIFTVRDLRGKRVAVGPRTSGIEQHARAIFGALGIGFDDFTPVYLDLLAGADALATDQIDAQLQRPIPNSVMSDLDARTDIRVVTYDPADLELILKEWPIYRKTTMRKGDLNGLKHDVAQPAVLNVLVTHARLDSEIVHSVATRIFNDAHELATMNALFKSMPGLFNSLKSLGPAVLEFDGVKLHAGALRAYQDLGLI
jgi:uncharacterized protein